MGRRAPLELIGPDRDAPGLPAEARLELTEFLVSCEDYRECVQRAVDWIHEHTSIERALCATVDGETMRLVGIAGTGFRPARVAEFVLEVEDHGHPLVAVLNGREPTLFSAMGQDRYRHPATPFGNAPFVAFPLPIGVERDGERAGLLLTDVMPSVTLRDVRWAADLVGRRLVRMRRLRVLADAERRMGRERTQLYAIVNAVTDPILLTDTEGRMMVANARAESLFASTEGESEGRWRAVSLNNMLLSAALSRQAIEGTRSTRRELLLVDPSDGSDLLFELITSVATDPREGEGLVSILRNVTDLRRATEEIEDNYRRLREAEAKVRAERDRLDLIIDSVVDPILVTDPSGNIVLMNAPAERLFTAAGHSSAHAQRAVRANDAHFSSFVSNLFFSDTGLRWRGEINLIDPQTGNGVPVEAISGKVVSDHGEVTAVVTILHDRSEAIERAGLYEQLKNASAELEQKVRDATAELVHQNELLRRQQVAIEQASQLKSQFLANMSHEFRTPLNAILGYTSMLLAGVQGALHDKQKVKLERVDSNANHLLALINDILDISRIEAGKMPLHMSEFPVHELITEVLQEVEPLIARAHLTATREIEASSPSLPSLRADRQKVKQIVLNLVTNAIKFTPKGTVTVCTRLADDELGIAVEDTGIGIAVPDRDTIFEDFRQADNSPSRLYGGAGLGLSICRRLAAMMDGRIVLESEVNRGSTFTLWLPNRPRRK